MSAKPSLRQSYRSYLLRLWRTAEARWCASLEDAHTGHRRTFATPAQLVAFLAQPPDDPDPPEPGGDPNPEVLL